MITSSTEFHMMPRMLKTSTNQLPNATSQQPPTLAPQNALQSQSQPQPTLDATKSSTDSGSESNSEELMTCARTLPLKRHSFSKRRIVKSQNILLSADRKAAKYSSVHCTCSGLPDVVNPCLLCSGRYDYTLNMDTEYMPQLERVALLDPGAHHVLSFTDGTYHPSESCFTNPVGSWIYFLGPYADISLGLHFSKLLKKESAQRLSSKPSPKK